MNRKGLSFSLAVDPGFAEENGRISGRNRCCRTESVAPDVHFFLGKTSGKMYIAQPELSVEVVRK